MRQHFRYVSRSLSTFFNRPFVYSFFRQSGLVLLFFLFMDGAAAMAQRLASPDGRLVFSFHQSAEGLRYNLSYDGLTVVSNSQLGVNINNQLVERAMGIPHDADSLWTQHMELIGVDSLAQQLNYHPVYGENSVLHDNYRQLVFHFRKGETKGNDAEGYNKRKQYLFDLVVRAYNEGLALRYHFPEATNGLFMHITADLTSFHFAPGAKALHTAWAQGPYQWTALTPGANGEPLGEKADSTDVWRFTAERPLFLRLPNGLNVALLEAGMHDFVRGKLRLKSENELQFAMEGDANVITPYDMPWRVVMVGRRAVDLINNKELVLHLNEPNRIADTRFIRPCRAFRCGTLNNQAIPEAIDFASQFGIEYVELDAGWYGPEMLMSSSALHAGPGRDFDMASIAAYGRSKGVGLWLYVNQRALYQELDSILPLYRRWGVAGIKFGFVQVGDQYWTRWLHNAVKKCADYGIMVDIHDEYRPTGWSRTYPNLLTQEGIRGNEEMPTATYNTVLPFTRYLCGPADYTLCYFNGRVKNTKAHQLALSVVYYSPLQFYFWYDKPSAYQGEQELNFWRACPTVWDESIALDGEPGEWIAQARRKGRDWFVGVLTNQQRRTVSIDTRRFLKHGKRYKVEMFEDDPTLNTRTKVRSSIVKMKAGANLTLHLQPSGGAALRFVEQ